LQSAKKSYGLYLFHERLNSDSIFSIQEKYINPKITLERNHLSELKARLDKTEGREKRNLAKEIEQLEEFIDELFDFQKKIKAVLDSGYNPDIDDGVILNMARFMNSFPGQNPKNIGKNSKKGNTTGHI